MARRLSFLEIFVVLALAGPLSGCLIAKTVTVPMCAGGAAISAESVVGNTVDKAVEVVADAVD